MRAMTSRRIPGWCVFALALLVPGVGVAGWPNNPYTNVGVCTEPLEQYGATVAPDGVGGSFVAWLDDRGSPAHRVFVQHLSSSGVPQWTAGGIALSASGVQSGPAITADGAGGAIVAWSGSGVRAQRVTADGVALWISGGKSLCSVTSSQRGLSTVADGAGGAIVGWLDNRSGSSEGYAQRIAADSSVMWEASGVHLYSGAFRDLPPALVATTDGGVVVAWCVRGSTASDIMAQRISGAGACLWPAGGVIAATAVKWSDMPVATTDGQDGAILAWVDGDNYQHHTKAQRITAAGDIPWAAGGVTLCDAPSTMYQGGIASDDCGGAFVAWGGSRGDVGDVLVQRVSADGGLQWLPGGVPLEVLSAGGGPYVIADGFGGAIVAWQRGYYGGIFAQRLSADGAPQWSAHGAAVSLAYDSGISGAVVADGTGGAILAWADSRSGEADIYAQGIDSAGALFRSEPVLTGVNDVPGDQGGRVRLAWTASNLDRPQAGFSMYGIWRRVSEPVAGSRAMRASVGAVKAGPGVYRTTVNAAGTTWWEGVDAVIADARSAYSFIVATTADSCAAEPSRETFMIDYHVEAWAAFWSTAPDSGCSVDNLPPARPAHLACTGGDLLQWDTPTEADFHHFDVYGSAVGHLDATATLLGATPNTQWNLAGPAYPWYLVTASDVHGNASAAAVTFAASAAPGTAAADLRLFPAHPNPFNPRTSLAFTLPQAGAVRITIFDLAGRAVRTLVDASLPPGRHEAEWDGRDAQGRAVGSGGYVARLECEGLVQVTRLELVR